MTRATNVELIIETLKGLPGLDDDELSVEADVHPRQQVNQICRILAGQRIVRRVVGKKGKIVNYLVGDGEPAPTSQRHSKTPRGRTPRKRSSMRPPPRHGSGGDQGTTPAEAFATVNLRSTLLVIPCSGAKASFPDRREMGPSILDALPAELARKLAEARRAVSARANVDEHTLVAAWRRYDGTLYQRANQIIDEAIRKGTGRHVVVLSGGYGLVLANEPIGMYNAVFRKSWWPSGLLEDALIAYAKHNGLKSVRAFASMTTEYSKLIKAVPWSRAGIHDAWLLTPEPVAGAMVKSPRAQGEALSTFLNGNLTEDWVSSDGLLLHALKLDR